MDSFPYTHVDKSLRALAGQAEGFGRHAIGGLHGAIYRVTTLADDGCGSLREGCRRKEPLWIIFEVSGTISLSSSLKVPSHKTIDGRGQKVKLTGKGLQLNECEHVIVCNIELEGGRGHDVDAIQIKPRSRHIWIDRCKLSDYSDGLIDICCESTDITVSRCYFSNHNKTMLIGADCSHVKDRCMRVTIHHCLFDGTRQRHPRVRFAKVHLYNNYTRNWGIYAVCASVESQIISQCNIYEAGEKKNVFKYLSEKAADREESTLGSIKSEGDSFLNGAKSCLANNANVECSFNVQQHYPTYSMQPVSQKLKEALQVCSGWQDVPRPADIGKSLRALAGQAEGFGRHAIGGLHGTVYHVTSMADDGCGSLREACRRKEPLWIVFEVSGTISLLSNLKVSSYKTIDGRGQKVRLTGKGLQLKECEHVIVCNIELEGGRGHDVDAIQIKPRSRHIWIDRCKLSDYSDGLLDICCESTDITVSRCYFSKHDKTMLIGADCSHVKDRCMRVTIHHCFFDGTRQRHPRVRFAKVHLYNNYTRNWGIYAVCASVESQIVSQCNIYEAGEKKNVFKYMTEKATDREESTCGSINSEGDLFLNDARSCLAKNNADSECVFNVCEYYPTPAVEQASLKLKEDLRMCTGWQDIPRPADHC